MANGTQMTLEELYPQICLKPMCTASDFHVKASALLASDKVSTIAEGLSFLKSCGLLKSESLSIYSLRMSQDCSPMRGGDTFETIIRTMDELGYGVEWQVLNSKYYVPQNRQRVFIVGHLGGFGGRAVFPFTAYGESADELQGHQRIIANAIDNQAFVRRGVYPIENGGGC